MIVNKRGLSEIVGVSERTLTDWQEAPGFPIELVGGRGLDNQYDTVKVIEWMVQRALAGQKAETGRERLERLQAEELEMKIDERAKRLVPLAEVEPVWTEAVIATRGELLELADRLKTKLDVAYRVNIDPTVIHSEVLLALSKLAAQAPAYGAAVEAAPTPVEEGAN